VHRALESTTSVNELRQRSRQDGGRSRRPKFSIKEAKVMEIAAAVLFCSIVLWFVEEATDEHV